MKVSNLRMVWTEKFCTAWGPNGPLAGVSRKRKATIQSACKLAETIAHVGKAIAANAPMSSRYDQKFLGHPAIQKLVAKSCECLK